jgi:hypothetical protein
LRLGVESQQSIGGWFAFLLFHFFQLGLPAAPRHPLTRRLASLLGLLCFVGLLRSSSLLSFVE